MKKLLIIGIVGISLTAFGQAWTNLSATLQSIYTNMPGAIMQNTADTWADYQKAVRLSPEFAGVVTVTNVVITESATNIVITTTTNHAATSFTVFFTDALKQEKVGRIVEQRNQDLRNEMYRKVGQTVVNAWP